MVKFSTYVKVYDKDLKEIIVFPSMVDPNQLKELREFCKKHEYYLVETKCIDTCCLPYEN